jgi:hypothetical protein
MISWDNYVYWKGIPVHAMKARGNKVTAPLHFYLLVERSTWRSGRFIPWEKTSCTLWVGRWEGFSAGPNSLAKRKMSVPWWEEPWFLGHSACTLVTNLTEPSGRIAFQFSARSLLILSIVVVCVPTTNARIVIQISDGRCLPQVLC